MANIVEVEVAEKELKAGYLVDVKFGQPKTAVTVSPKSLGYISTESSDVSDFMDAFVENNRISFIGKRNESMRKLLNVSKSVHKRKKVLALGNSESFMTDAILREFREYLDKQKAEYFKYRDELISQYDDLVVNFTKNLKEKFLNNTLVSLPESKRAEVVLSIVRKIPTRQEFEDSFSVGLRRTKIIGTTEVSEDEQDEVVTGIKETINDFTGKSLNIAFSGLNNLLGAYQKTGVINGRNKSVLTNIVNELQKRNIFDLALLKDLANNIEGLKLLDTLTMAEEIEVLVSQLYMQAKNLGIEEELNLNDAVMSIDDMEMMAALQ